MRKLLALALVVALVVGYLVVDTVVRTRVERDIAAHIESDVPGASATVRISSWPFTGRVAVAGDVSRLTAEVTGVRVGSVEVQSVDLVVTGITVDRRALVQGRAALRSIRSATVTAVITQAALDTGTGLPVTLGAGTVGIAGVQLPATVSIAGGHLDIGVAGLRTIALPLLPASLLPCDVGGTITPGALVLRCTTAAIPAALSQVAAAAHA